MFVALNFKLKFKYCSFSLISACLKLQKNKTDNRQSVILFGQMSYAAKVQTECHKAKRKSTPLFLITRVLNNARLQRNLFDQKSWKNIFNALLKGNG